MDPFAARGIDGQTFAVRSERAEDYEVGSDLGDRAAYWPAKFRGKRRPLRSSSVLRPACE